MKSEGEVQRGLSYWQGFLDALNWSKTYSDKPVEMDSKYLEAEASVRTLEWVLKEEKAAAEIASGHTKREEVVCEKET